MDVELQILKHLRRDAHPTVGVIDEYCEEYRDIFKEVRNYECFKYLHLGIISTLKRKSLPEIAKVVSINSAQSLHLRGLGQISGVNLPEHLVTKNQRLDISAK
jgi:SRSO17 transposase